MIFISYRTMVSHSSSASLGSFHFSHASSSSSSSLSSPPSSPDSLQDTFAAPASSSSPSSTLTLVPFLWEERPGVLKESMQISEGGGHDRRRSRREVSSSDQGRIPFSFDVHARAQRTDSCTLSSRRMSRAFPASRCKTRSESVPHLRPPPRLSHPTNLHVYVQSGDDGVDNHHHQHQWGTSVGIKSKVMSSLSFHKRRHRRATSLEDDPFWMAMVACTNDEGKGSHMQFKGNRDKVCGEMQRTDSWFTRRVQEHSIHFEQCMPRHTSNVTEKSRASSHSRNNSNKGGRDIAKKDNQRSCTDASMHSTHLATKAFKALNIAKSELQGRCKVLLQQQGAPVDISCTTRRRSKKPSFASKRKLPDLLGCKSHHPLSTIQP